MELDEEEIEEIKQEAQDRLKHKRVSKIKDEPADIEGTEPATIAEKLRSRARR